MDFPLFEWKNFRLNTLTHGDNDSLCVNFFYGIHRIDKLHTLPTSYCGKGSEKFYWKKVYRLLKRRKSNQNDSFKKDREASYLKHLTDTRIILKNSEKYFIVKCKICKENLQNLYNKPH